VFNQHYSELSSRDHGTLYQMKIRLNKIGKGVKKSVKDAVNDCGEFLRINTKIYIVLAATHLLHLSDPNDSPVECPELECKQKKQDFFDIFALSIIDNYVLDGDYDPHNIIANPAEFQTQKSLQTRIKCGYPQCTKSFAVDGLVRQRHRRMCIYKDLMVLENDIAGKIEI